jgi:Secretion system C-terminal sorting domain/FG-GAP-like repeat
MKNQIIFFLFFITQFSIPIYCQINWESKGSILKFPTNFTEWIKRNVPFTESLPNKSFNQLASTHQSKQFFDFNKDGKKDITIDIGLEYYLGSKDDSAYRYYKGIFINNGDGTYSLDTNYIITGRGRSWYGKFGDFNGDGKLDYIQLNENYHGDQSKKPLDLFRYGNDLSPSDVFFNNGKSFDRIFLDTLDMMSVNCMVHDIDKDGFDEIISMPSEKFIVYKYNKSKNTFDKKLNNINDSISKWYNRTIKWFHFDSVINNKMNITVSYNSFSENKEDWMIDIVEVNLYDSSLKIINRFQHPLYSIKSRGIISNATLHANSSMKYFDYNNDGVNELIMISPFNFSGNERMGFNIIENNLLKTETYWKYDTTEIGFRIQGYIKELSGDNFNDIVAGEWTNWQSTPNGFKIDSTHYFPYYYKYDSGTYKKYKINTINKDVIPRCTECESKRYNYWTWVEDFNSDGIDDIFLYNNGNIYENYLYSSINCPTITKKPVFNTSKFSFCSGDSLKLSITNVNKGDTLKWYFGTKSDLTNVANKTFNDSSKLYVTRTDSVGCIISSDTIQLSKIAIPNAPTLGRDSSNNLVANINGITWYKDGVKISDTTQKIKPTSNGNYTATTTQNSCTSSTSASYYYLTLAAANLSSDEFFKISPNPTNGEIFLNFNIRNAKDLYINVIDMSGRMIISNRKVNSGTKMNLGSSMKGNYILQVKDKTGKLLATEKLIKN